MLYLWLQWHICCIREKDIDIAFAQDAIDEYKVICPSNCVCDIINFLFNGYHGGVNVVYLGMLCA